MPLRLDNAKSVAHMPTAEQQQTKKDFKPRFKVDPAASPMPEIRLPERLATGRHQNRNAGRDHLGMLGEIKSEYPGEIVGIGTHEILLQMKKAIDTAVKFQEVHGYFPSSDFIQSELKLYDEYERQSDREREGQLGQETIDRWREDGFFERMLAKHTICRGALQIAASGLIGQDTQQRNGAHEFHEGLHQLERLREERIRKEREAPRGAPPAAVNSKPREA